MVGERIGESINLREELIKKGCALALKAHKSGKLYLTEKIRSGGSSEVVFSFPGSGSVDEWFYGRPFGETEVDLNLFPYLRSIGNNEAATVNEAFSRRFEAILRTSQFANEVKKAVADRRRIVFSGHSSGGPTAILATLWFLEEYIRQGRNQNLPVCVTFGSPLVGDRIYPHALKRQKWDGCFIHFVMRYDVVPRIMLAPLSYTDQQLEQLKPALHFFNPKSSSFGLEPPASEASTFFMTVMTNLSSVASHAACNLMGCTNSLLDTITNFKKLSPYKPFGTYIFCTGNGKLVVVKNSDAALQLLFYSSQLSCEAESTEVAYKSLKEHLGYEDELKESLVMQDVVYLDDHLTELPLSSDGTIQVEIATVNTALNDLGLSTKARLCLRAAGELQEQKQKNQNKINDYKKEIKEKLKSIQAYRTACDSKGYYDAFKLQDYERDFLANVTRLKLAGMWDEIIEMLKRYELPDEFEGQPDWIELGTKFRWLVEPLDIANYYRHLKHEDSGPYLDKVNPARPRRYRYTQRWHEHAERMPPESSSESCFLAIVEELRRNNKPLEDKDKILKLETEVLKWYEHGEIGKDVFLDESTFTKWWKTLPDQHRKQSCIAQLMCN